MAKYFFFIIFAILSLSCENNVVESELPDENCSTVESFYNNSVASIMTQSCNNCHSGTSPSGGIRTNNYSDVKAGIVSILDRVQRDINENGFMPTGGQKLSNDKISILQIFLEMECE